MRIPLNRQWYVLFTLYGFYFKSFLLAGLRLYKIELNLSIKILKSNIENIWEELEFIFGKVEFVEFMVIFICGDKVYVFLVGRTLFLFNSNSVVNSLNYYLSTSTKYFSSHEIIQFEDINLFNESFKKYATSKKLIKFANVACNGAAYYGFDYGSLRFIDDRPFSYEPFRKKDSSFSRVFEQPDITCKNFMTSLSFEVSEFTIIRIWLLFVKSKELFVKDSKLLFVKDHTVFADNYLEYLSDNFIVICQQLSVKYPFSFMEFNPLDLGINYLQKAKRFIQENSAILSFEFLHDYSNIDKKFSIK